LTPAFCPTIITALHYLTPSTPSPPKIVSSFMPIWTPDRRAEATVPSPLKSRTEAGASL
ncbi:hypothetical protein BaRGS_00004011, partial [Batillaria attramentaria]